MKYVHLAASSSLREKHNADQSQHESFPDDFESPSEHSLSLSPVLVKGSGNIRK
jgi:hypothetical protein